jgi:hypothetical protein
VKRGLALLALVLVLWLGWQAFTLITAGLGARENLVKIQILAADPTIDAVPVVRENLADLEGHLLALRAAAGPLLWLAPHAGWLPRVGPDLRAAPALLEMGIALVDGGNQALQTLKPATDLLLAERGKGDLLAQVVPALADAAPRLTPVSARLADAATWRGQIYGPLAPQVDRLLAKFDEALPVAQTGLQLLQIAPSLLGADGPHTYLLLAQNNHELRATGGYISGVGIVRFENGQMSDLRLADSYAVDNLSQPHPDAPRVLAEQMGTQLLLLRDSNWSPDFPTSAEVARLLYEQDQGVATDGAIAVDLEAVRLLVGAVEPVQVPGMPTPVTSANVIDQIRRAWEQPNDGQSPTSKQGGIDWFNRRKDFMGPLMMAVLTRLQSGEGLHPTALGKALTEMLAGRHLQIAVDDEPVAKMLAEHGWDGALHPIEGSDFLAIVDSNLGYNKTNAAVQQAVTYQIEPDAQGPVATLVVTYTHTAPSLSGTCDREVRLLDGSYDDMIARCHWDYMRVYLPADSTLLSSEGLENVESEVGEGGTTMVGGNFVLRPGESREVQLSYRLPAGALQGPYRLTVRKQAGTITAPLTIQAGPCRWNSDLSRDRTFECAAWPK